MTPAMNDTVQIRFTLRGGETFWQTNGTIAAVSSDSVVLDGFDRPVRAAISELKPFGLGRWSLDWEVRGRP